MAYLIFTDIKEAEAHQANVDAELHYPESLDSLRWVGGGIHAPKELGRAINYAQIIVDDVTKAKFALPTKGKITTDPKATVVTELPVGFVKVVAPIGELPVEEEMIK